MKMIYMSHPFTGDEERNTKDARYVENLLLKLYPGSCVVNPLDLFSGMTAEDENGYVKILACCLEVLGRCDMIFMCTGWKSSAGCKAELALALQKGIEVAYD